MVVGGAVGRIGGADEDGEPREVRRKRGRVRLEDAPQGDGRNRAGRPVEPDQSEVRRRARRVRFPAGVATPGFDGHGRNCRKEAVARGIAGDDPSGRSVGLEEHGGVRGLGEWRRRPEQARHAFLLDPIEKQHVPGAPHRVGEESVVRGLRVEVDVEDDQPRPVPGKAPDQAGVEGTWQLVDVAGPAEGLSRLRREAFVESWRHAVEGADVALQPADRGTVEPDDQSTFGRRQVAPCRIEHSEPELTFERPSQRGQRQQRYRDRAQGACNQTSDHSASLHARPIATPIWFVGVD